jgi:Cu+-exporting ATPase
MVGTGKGAQKGILIKDAQALEVAHKVKTVIFDKTGTLTKGKPQVTDIVPVSPDSMDSDSSLKIAGSLEKGSEHALAEAIVSKAKEESIALGHVEGFKAIAGFGIEGSIDGTKYYFGNRALAKKQKVDFEEYEEGIKKLEKEGKTVMLLIRKDKLIAFVAVADTLKESAKYMVEKLKKKNIQVWMITGDNKATAEAIASQVGIENVIAEMLPEEKSKNVSDIKQKTQGVVAFVGDGVNDAPALAAADVGIAMGSGTDVAIESAGITLLNKDLTSVVEAIELSRKTMRTIKENLFWAFGYNVILIPVAMGVLYPIWKILLNPELAAFAMAASSISVVANSLRLKGVKI